MVDLEGEAEAEDLGSDGRASAEVGRPKSARGRGGSKKRSSKKVEAAAALVAHSLENQANMRPANRMESQFGSVVMKPTPMVGHFPPRPQSRGVQR